MDGIACAKRTLDEICKNSLKGIADEGAKRPKRAGSVLNEVQQPSALTQQSTGTRPPADTRQSPLPPRQPYEYSNGPTGAWDDDELDDILADQFELQQCSREPSPPPDEPTAARFSIATRDTAVQIAVSDAAQTSRRGETATQSGSVQASNPQASQHNASQPDCPEFDTAGEDNCYFSLDDDPLFDGISQLEDLPPTQSTQQAAAVQRVVQAEADPYSEGLHMDVSLGAHRLSCRVRNAQSAIAGRTSPRPTHSGRLLATSIDQLMQQVESANHARLVNAGTLPPETPTAESGNAVGGVEADSWVDKYRPRNFLDLLSDEVTNRGVARWLQSWHGTVFPADAAQAQSAASSRPEHRMLLLSGPPGLGKTTLAHVVATHCGYTPLEINASDDRSASALVSRVQDAAQMQAVLGAKRPNCIIIDEIDGTAGGNESQNAIQALIKLVQGSWEAAPSAAGSFGATGRRQQKGNGLMRPVICICNDLYASVVRPLRAAALCFAFTSPSVDRLISRMKGICLSERLVADRQGLATLAERSAGDVRCCLNTLQFLGRRGWAVRAADVAHTCAGHKDITRGAFAVWEQLLWTRHKRNLGRGESRTARTARLLDLVGDFGEYDLIVSGCHHNVFSLNYRDGGMMRTAEMAEQMGDVDRISAAIHRRSDFSLMKFLPSAILSVALAAAGPEKPFIKWPQAMFEVRRRAAAAVTLLRAWVHEAQPSVRASLTVSTAVLTILPALEHVLLPEIRPVAQHLRSTEETAALEAVVCTMDAYRLSYGNASVATAAEKAASFHSAHSTHTASLPVHPPVDQLCRYQGQSKRRQLSAAQQQVITVALQTERIRRRHVTTGENASHIAAESAPTQGQDLRVLPKAGAPAALGFVPLTVAQRAKATLATGGAANGKVRKANWLEVMRVAKGRVGARKAAPGLSPASGGPKLKLKATFKYHEGYTNAVKRPVLMSELLQ